MGQDAVTSRRRRRRRKAPACRRSRRREESAVENDRSEGDLTLIAGNTWWNTRGSRSGTKRPPRDLSLIDEVRTSPPLIGRRRARPSTSPARFTIRDEHRARHHLLFSLFFSCHRSIPALIGREIGQGSGKPISSAEEMDDGSNTI